MKFKFLSVFLSISVFSQAAIVTVCNSGCTTSNLQTAFDTLANCGDTIQIKSTDTQIGNFTVTYRGCVANPIIVTSDRAATYLTNGNVRITPSQLANMAHITTPNTSPALADALDGMGRPPAGWNFIGIAFTSSNAGPTYALVWFNFYQATGPTQIANNITFDRCYFYRSSTYVSGNDMQNGIHADATNITIKNSFFGDMLWNGIETHSIIVLTNPGPVTFTNNFITTSSIPIFFGGSTPSYPVYVPNGGTIEYNYFWRPWKYNFDTGSPYASLYTSWAGNTSISGPFTVTGISNTGVVTTSTATNVGSGSIINISSVGGCTVANANGWRVTNLSSNTFQLLNFPGCNSAYTSGGTVNIFGISTCNKNLGEFKFGQNYLWSYNVGENSWVNSQCLNQYNGFTDTLRTEWDSTSSAPSLGTVTMVDSTHFTWTGTYRVGGSGADSTNTDDLGVCAQLTTGVECHTVASFSGASLVAATPFTSIATGSVTFWVVYAASAQLSNLTISHNVWKNSDESLSILAISPNNGVGNSGYGLNHTISQNLWYANSSYTGNPKIYGITPGEFPYTTGINPTGYTIDHNTVYNPNGTVGSFLFINSTSPIQPVFNLSTITNNLWGTIALNSLPFAGDGTVNTSTTTNAYFTNTNVKNNGIPSGTNGPGGTGGNTISGNIYTAWSDPFGGLAPSGIFNIQPSSPYYHAGTDGASLGADFTQLPMVTGISVNGDILQFTTNTQNNDVKNTQPCVLEVSTSSNLQTDLGTYSVVADLDPTITPGADNSLKASVTQVGNVTTWPISGLTNGTTYYGRLQCYGDMEMFSFVASTPITQNLDVSGKSTASGKVILQ